VEPSGWNYDLGIMYVGYRNCLGSYEGVCSGRNLTTSRGGVSQYIPHSDHFFPGPRDGPPNCFGYEVRLRLSGRASSWVRTMLLHAYPWLQRAGADQSARLL
jgi:hypothetical protein